MKAEQIGILAVDAADRWNPSRPTSLRVYVLSTPGEPCFGADVRLAIGNEEDGCGVSLDDADIDALIAQLHAAKAHKEQLYHDYWKRINEVTP
jgi:hypothetical protein